MQNLYVRVNPKAGDTQFYRCALLFTLAWSMVEVDAATAARLHEEQMLDTSETVPEGYEAEVAEAAKPENSLSDADKFTAITEAMAGLDQTLESNWTKGGFPHTAALAAIVGFDVRAGERDAAWAELQKERLAIAEAKERLAAAEAAAGA